jgi:hypothetical protein
MGRGFALLFAWAFGPLLLAGCEPDWGFDADGTLPGVTGGAETDAATGLALQRAPGPPYPYTPLTPGNGWTSLYTDYFGAPQKLADGGFSGGRAACSGNGICHGDAGQTGAQVSGYICAGDATDAGKDECYASITSSMLTTVLLMPGASFVDQGLWGQLNSVENTSGPMPLGPPDAASPTPDAGNYPAYQFSAEDLARLSAWVDAGFPNN